MLNGFFFDLLNFINGMINYENISATVNAQKKK